MTEESFVDKLNQVLECMADGDSTAEIEFPEQSNETMAKSITLLGRARDYIRDTEAARKEREQQLRTVSLYSRGLLEASLDALVTISPEGKITDVNAATEEATGVSREKLIGTDFSLYFTEPQKAGEGYRKVLTEGLVRDYPLTIRHASGRTIDVLYNATTYKNEAGELKGVFAAARDVTERKRMEEQLRTVSLYSRALLEANLDALVTISPEGKITDVNAATEEATGVPRNRLIGTDFSSYFTEPQMAGEGYRKVLAEGLVRDYPLTIRHASGRTIDVLYNATTYKNEAGELQGVFAAARDVTERKRMIDELEAQNWFRSGQTELNDRMRGELETAALARNILSFLCRYLNVQIGTFYAKKDNTFRLFSSYAYVRRKNISNVYELGEGLVGQAALEKEPIIVRNVPPDYIAVTSGLGEAAPRNILIFPFIFEGEVKGVIELGAFDEFTDRQLQFIKIVSENIAIAFDSSAARQTMREMLEKTQQQARDLQQQAEELQVQSEELQAQQEELKASNEEMERKNEILERQTAYLEKQKTEMERKNVELQNARSEIEEKASQLELTSSYKTEFIANMSHELRTPLNSILILTKILEENKEGTLKADQLESLQVIYNSASDLLTLINQILDLSKIEAGKMDLNIEEIQPSCFLSFAEKNFRPVAEYKKLTFEVKMEEGLPETIRSDRTKIEQIIRNLTANAIKFTDQGSVSITVGRPSSTAALPGLKPEKAISITVGDTGLGIPLDKQKIIFKAFEQAHDEKVDKSEGAGLGLYISRKLARFLGGEIEFSSTEGEGSRFHFCFPETPESVDEKCGDRCATLESRGFGPIITEAKVPETVGRIVIPDDRDEMKSDDMTVLIIEDDAQFAKTLFDISHRRGFKCIVAGDGETGLVLARSFLPKAIILDLILPGIDGWVVMEELKSDIELRHIPVHIISALDEKVHAMKEGAIGYLEKPVTNEQLYGAFDKIEKFISERIRKLLVIDDDGMIRKEIVGLLGSKNIEIFEAGTGAYACELLKSRAFDCVVLDLVLPDMSGFQLLDKMRSNDIVPVPVIVYTAKELTREEALKLREYAESIIIKDIRSPERLLDEVTLFLHRVDSDLQTDQKKMIRMVHDREAIMKNKKILVVDDDMRNTFALAKLLRDKGMRVTLAEDGKKALEALDREPDFDLVLMDIMMPRMNGCDATRAIRKQQRFSKLPVIALTAKAMKEDREKCLQAGANEYLAKPVEVEKLLSMLRVWLYK